MNHLPLDPIIVPDTLSDGIHWLARLQVEPDGRIRLLVLLLQTDNGILNVEAAV